ncbi:MAG TPA: 50S ribosomal protein L4 [Pyrinomonadaceae bacterium]|jgi:large subunit ribosomal protein L4|nr:50S ribosomal protein L4 [Pyrinomonadaceae bacterium]
MPTVKVRNLKNKEVGELNLSDSVFGVELNEPLIHAALVNFRANARQGTSATKTRGNVSGSGRKLWKQKGTGRARVASLRSPLWKGGGNVHGPQPRDWSYSIPKKMRRGALRSALSERLREGNIIVVDELKFDAPKTKEFISAMGRLGAAEKTLVIDSLENANLILSARNVQKTKVTNSFGLNIYDILYHEKLVFSQNAIQEIERLLDPGRESASEGETNAAKGETSQEQSVSEAKPKATRKRAASSEEKEKAAKTTAKADSEAATKTRKKKTTQTEKAEGEE